MRTTLCVSEHEIGHVRTEQNYLRGFQPSQRLPMVQGNRNGNVISKKHDFQPARRTVFHDTEVENLFERILVSRIKLCNVQRKLPEKLNNTKFHLYPEKDVVISSVDVNRAR